jgi:Flp pilus assembly protein CpaB
MRLTFPKQRAVFGGLLIAVAAVLAFLAASGNRSVASTAVVIARHSIAPGTTLSEADLEIRSIPGAEQLISHTFGSIESLIGSRMLASVENGELIQQSAVRTNNAEVEPRLSFPISREFALDGDLRSGDTVDILATFGSGLDAETAVLARSARISSVHTSDPSSSSGAGRFVITATFTTPDQVLDVAHAAQVAALTLIRTATSSSPTTGRTIVTSPGALSFGAGSQGNGIAAP